MDAGNASFVAVKDAEALARVRIPDTQRAVPAGRHDQVLVGRRARSAQAVPQVLSSFAVSLLPPPTSNNATVPI